MLKYNQGGKTNFFCKRRDTKNKIQRLWAVTFGMV